MVIDLYSELKVKIMKNRIQCLNYSSYLGYYSVSRILIDYKMSYIEQLHTLNKYIPGNEAPTDRSFFF